MADNEDISACAAAINRLAAIDAEIAKVDQRRTSLQGLRDAVAVEVDGRKAAMLAGATYQAPLPTEPAAKRGVFGGIINLSKPIEEPQS